MLVCGLRFIDDGAEKLMLRGTNKLRLPYFLRFCYVRRNGSLTGGNSRLKVNCHIVYVSVACAGMAV
jgi:hypothetical protein